MPSCVIDDHLTLHYDEAGQGRPIVFIHGVMMSARFFQRQLPFFGENYHALALDLRGHGRSSNVAHGHTMPTYAQDLRAFLTANGLRDVVLVGWSMGCMVIWEYVNEFGDADVAATVLVDQGPSDFKSPAWEHGIFDLDTLTDLMAGLQTDPERTFREVIPLLFKDSPSDEDAAWMLAENLKIPPAIACSVLYDQTMRDYREDVAALEVPTLIVFGSAEGKLMPVEAAVFLRERIAGSQLSLYENSSHCPFLEETDRFNEEVDAFIRALD